MQKELKQLKKNNDIIQSYYPIMMIMRIAAEVLKRGGCEMKMDVNPKEHLSYPYLISECQCEWCRKARIIRNKVTNSVTNSVTRGL